MQLAALLDRLDRPDRLDHLDRLDGVPGVVRTAAAAPEPTARQLAGGIPCRDNDAELWFADRPADVEFAKTLCGACPVRKGCLAGALERQEPWGVWGGELFEAGIVVPRKRPRGRPRKDDPRYTDDPRFMGRRPGRATSSGDSAA